MDAYGSVREFERSIAEYTGAPYAVSVDSCSNALALCCQYRKVWEYAEVEVPAITYPSAASAVVHAGGRVKFTDLEWQRKGWYEMSPTGIVDSAKYLARGMFDEIDRPFICLSFHIKKTIPIGRGGMILTYSQEAYEWLKAARFDGRHETWLQKDTLGMAGWNCYMTPEQASRGLALMQWLPDRNILPPDPYQDLSQYSFFTEANRSGI